MRHERHGRDHAASLFPALLLALLVVLSAAASLAAEANPAGQISLVEARTEVHKERSLKSPVVAVLAPGERVQTGFLRDGFYALFPLSASASSEAHAVGFVPAGMVKPLAAPQTAPAQVAEFKPAPAAKAAPARVEGKSAGAPELKAPVKEGPGLLGSQPPMLSKDAPVRITSDRMVYNQAENSVVFIGNVHGTHTDMAIWSERLTAYFTDKKKGKDKPQPVNAQDKAQDKPQDKGPGDFGDSIERIVAEGNVRMVANKNDGACAKLTYMVAEGVMRMEGNPILREGQNTVRGEVIKFYIRENRSEVLSGTQRRVEAIFYTPKGEEGKK